MEKPEQIDKLPILKPEEVVFPDIPKPDNREVIDVQQQLANDETKLNDLRKELFTTPQNDEGERKILRIIYKPEKEWKIPKKITTDSPFDKLEGFLKSFSKEERKKRENIKKNVIDLNQDRNKFPEVEFNYTPGAGIEGRVCKESGLLATGFYECSALIFQTLDSVSIIHISPSTIRDETEGGEIVKDNDIDGHIKSALKQLISDSANTEITQGRVELSKDEIKKLQKMIDSGELKATMLAGEDNFVPSISTGLANTGEYRGLPRINTDTHYVGSLSGEGGYAVYATPKDIYFISSDNNVLKKGVDFPPTMFDYEGR